MKKLLFVALVGLMMVAFSACKNAGVAAADDLAAAAKEYSEAKDQAAKDAAVQKGVDIVTKNKELKEDDVKAFDERIKELEKDEAVKKQLAAFETAVAAKMLANGANAAGGAGGEE